ncbi:MAG: TonB-dependent receptor domain-containing protein [Pyrinomonadaceae bacterium]
MKLRLPHRLRTFLTIASFLLSIFVVNASAQNSDGEIVFTVQDIDGRAIPNATIKLEQGGITSRIFITDGSGIVKIGGLSTGRYQLIVSADGFAPYLKEIDTQQEPLKSMTITLRIGGITESVNVTAARTQITDTDTAVPVSVIGREQIEQRAANTLGDIFRTLPGTSTVNEGAFQVRPRIRGLDSNRVLILVDGERLNNSRTSTAQSGIEVGLVDLSQVESVEVVRGSGSVLYGTDALAGTINIITNDTPTRRDSGFRFGGRLDGFYTSNETGRRGSLAVTGSSRYFAFRLSQSLDRFGNYSTGKPDAAFLASLRQIGVGISDNGEVFNSQSHGSNSAATVRAFINDKNTIRATYDRRRAANIGSPGLVGTFNGFFPFSNRDKVNLRFDSAGITRMFERLSISGYYQTQYRNFTNILTVPQAPPFFPGVYQFSETVTDTKSAGYDVQTDWRIGKKNFLTAGTSFFRDENKDRRLIISASTPTSTNRRISTTRSVPNASLTNFAAFVQDEFRLNDRIRFIGGVRVDRFDTKSEPTTGFALPALRQDQINDLGIGNLATGLSTTNTAVTGDFGAVVKLTEKWSATARIGRSFRTPNIFELFFTDTGSVGGFIVGNPRLRPETGINFDTGLKYRSKHLSASATYFSNFYRDLLATVPANDSRGCPIFIVRPGTVYDSANCQIVSSPPGASPVRVFQTQNIDRARIQGFEAEFEAPIRISLGYLTPNGNFSYLRGDDTDKNQPLNFISPFRTNVGFRWQNFGKAYFFDYYARIVGKQKRLSDSFLLPVNQGGNGGPEPGFVTHNINGGYYFRREKYTLSITAGISNLFNRAYSEQFVFAPARGRSFTFGTGIELR